MMSETQQDLSSIDPGIAYPYSKEWVLSLIDLTRLDEHANSEDIQHLADLALQYQTACVCVLPQHLSHAAHARCATVLNFPNGDEPHIEVLRTIERLTAFSQLKEVDYVFPYHLYLYQNSKQALSLCQQVIHHAQQCGFLIKIILETGAFDSMDVLYTLCTEIIAFNGDFLKTSTGRIAKNVTLQHAHTLLTAMRDTHANCGIKYSGGIRTPQQAQEYIQLTEQVLGRVPDKSWFRFGASTLLEHFISL